MFFQTLGYTYYLKHEQQCFFFGRSRMFYTLIKHVATASVLNGLKNERSYLFICEVTFKVNVV